MAKVVKSSYTSWWEVVKLGKSLWEVVKVGKSGTKVGKNWQKI